MRIIFALPLLLTACIGGGSGALQYQGMSADQITAAAKDNKAVFQCNDLETPSIGGGVLKSKFRAMVIDSGTVQYGRFKATTCDDIEFTNDRSLKPAPAPKTPVYVAPGTP